MCWLLHWSNKLMSMPIQNCSWKAVDKSILRKLNLISDSVGMFSISRRLAESFVNPSSLPRCSHFIREGAPSRRNGVTWCNLICQSNVKFLQAKYTLAVQDQVIVWWVRYGSVVCLCVCTGVFVTWVFVYMHVQVQCQISIPRSHTTCFWDKVSLTDTWNLTTGLKWPAAPRDPPVSAPQHGDYTHTPLCPAMVMVSRGANTGPHTYKTFSDCATSPDSLMAFIRWDNNTMLPKVLTCTLFKLRHYLNSSLMARACTELFSNLWPGKNQKRKNREHFWPRKFTSKNPALSTSFFLRFVCPWWMFWKSARSRGPAGCVLRFTMAVMKTFSVSGLALSVREMWGKI